MTFEETYQDNLVRSNQQILILETTTNCLGEQ